MGHAAVHAACGVGHGGGQGGAVELDMQSFHHHFIVHCSFSVLPIITLMYTIRPCTIIITTWLLCQLRCSLGLLRWLSLLDGWPAGVEHTTWAHLLRSLWSVCPVKVLSYLVLPALVNKSVLIPLVVKLWLLPPVLLLVDSLWHCCAFEMLTVSLLLPSILGPASQPKPMSRIQHLNILVIA